MSQQQTTSENRKGAGRRVASDRRGVERRVNIPWVVDISDQRSGFDRRTGERRSGFDRRDNPAGVFNASLRFPLSAIPNPRFQF